MNRRDELAFGLRRVHERIEAACVAAGRSADGVRLVVVTKAFPAADVRMLAELGVRDVGENRDQEAVAKASECADLGLRWHFVGQLQANKVGSVVRYATAVHSVDRARLVQALDRAATAAQRVVDCFVQVALDDRPGRGGGRPGEAPELADQVVAARSLRLVGMSAVAPLDEDPDAAFARLERVADEVRARHPSAAGISAGMSGDLEAAIGRGATHLRVGSAILGPRPLRV